MWQPWTDRVPGVGGWGGGGAGAWVTGGLLVCFGLGVLLGVGVGVGVGVRDGVDVVGGVLTGSDGSAEPESPGVAAMAWLPVSFLAPSVLGSSMKAPPKTRTAPNAAPQSAIAARDLAYVSLYKALGGAPMPAAPLPRSHD